MTLLYPAALFGLFAAATPVVIYLLLRRRKTEVQWGAGYLLRLALASRKKSSRWRQMVILAVRSLILALAAFLIAQPFRPGVKLATEAPALPERAVHRVVLFDNSRSMTVTEDSLTRLDRARRAAEALLRSQRAGDMLDLIPLIPQAAGALEPVTLSGVVDDDRAEHAPAAIPVRDGVIPLEPALAAAMTRLATTPGSAGEIYFLSDFPRELESQIDRVAWFAPLAKDRGVRIAPVNMIGPAGGESEQNVSIDAVTLGTDLLVAGVPTRLYIDACNHSDHEAAAIFNVSAANGGSNVALARQTVRINPDEHKRISIPLTLSAGNAQVLTITAQPSRIASQGTGSLSVDVKDALDVWLVADEKEPPSAGGTEGSTPDDIEFFKRAIRVQPGQSAGVRLRSARMNELTLPIPDKVDAIVLVGPAYTTPAIAGPLTDFVRRGGGLIITASPALKPPAFNENLAALLPAPLDKPMRPAIDPETFLQAQVQPPAPDNAPANDQQRPLFEEFAAPAGQGAAVPSDLAQARFYNHFRLADPQAVTGVILRLSNGDPLLVEKQIGRGRVFFYASTLGVEWTSLPVRQSYIPFVTRLLSAAVAGGTLPLNLDSEATFITPWPGRGSATLTLPDQSTREVNVLDAARGQFIVLDNLHDAGLYRLADAAGHHSAFTIVPSTRSTGSGQPGGNGAAETDLRSLPDAAKAKLAAALGADVFPNWASAVNALGPAGARSPLWPWLLAAILALYLFETWFVRSV